MLKKTVSMAIVSAALSIAISGCSDSSKDDIIRGTHRIDSTRLATFWEEPTVNAEELVNQMTNRELIGQVMALDFRHWGKNANGSYKNMTKLPAEVAMVIHDYALGSIILFRGNVEKNDETYRLVQDIQNSRYKLPLFIGIDQEGGYVTRLQQGTELPGNMAIAATRDVEIARQAGVIHGKELNALGIHFNFAPVVDVNVDQRNPVIGVRSYSSDTGVVIDMSTAYIDGLHSQNVMGSAKHFPGHGNTATDTHFALSTVPYTESEWRDKDLPPFREAIANGIDSIMTAHVTFPNLDNTKVISKFDKSEIPLPSTLSRKILTDILRDELQYKGLIFTDALEMDAIAKHFGTNEAVETAILAGVDVALMPVTVKESAQWNKLIGLYQYLETRMAQNSELSDRIKESALRVVKKKLEKQVTHELGSFDDMLSIVGSAEHKLAEVKMAEKAITLIKNENSVLPYKLVSGTRILLIADAQARNELVESELNNITEKAGGVGVEITSIIYDLMSQEEEGKSVLPLDLTQTISEHDLVVITAHSLGKNPNAAIETVEIARFTNKPVVLIAGRNPYDIAYLQDVNANIAIYGVTGYDQTNQDRNSLEANIRAGVRSLFTKDGAPEGLFVNPTGKLPVDIKDISDENNITTLYPFGHGLSYPG